MENIIKKAIEGGYKDLLSFVSENQFWVVCNTKKTTFVEDEEGSYFGDTKEVPITVSERKEVIVCDPLFWQSLGKACGWEDTEKIISSGTWSGNTSVKIQEWKENALKFHEINLTEGWDKAVKWLEDLISK